MKSGGIREQGEELGLRSSEPRELNSHQSIKVKLGDIPDVVEMEVMKLSLYTGREGAERSQND